MRSCDNCTKCCEGTLSGEALGHTFYPGKPCHFVTIGKGCGIYKDRPTNPCRVYQCLWRKNDVLPLWMKPSDINAIVDERMTPSGIGYIRVHEAGSRLDSRVLSWLIEWALTQGVNIHWTIDGGNHWIGSPKFLEEMKAA